MRLLAFSLMLALAGCFGSSGTKESLAQCRLDSYGPAGTNFMREFTPIRPSRPDQREDRAYSNFLINCMEAKGYEYAALNDEMCWNDEGATPWEGGPSCFSRSWW